MNNRLHSLFRYLVLLAVIILILLPCASDSRVGGGESYSGGGHSGGGYSGGGGGGSGDGELILWLLYLIIEYPSIGIPLVIIIIVYYIYNSRRQVRMLEQSDYSTRSSFDNTYAQLSYRGDIRGLKDVDPNFSRPLFMDFLQLFFTRVHKARGEHKWESVRPYIEPNLCSSLIAESESLQNVENIIMGSARIINITIANTIQRVAVEFEANFDESRGGQKKDELYSREQWSFQRKAGVLSKGPADIASFACPYCGSPAELRPDGSCPYCSKVVNKGDFHWQLYNVTVITRGPKPPIKLSLGGEEAGSERPTVFQSNFERERRSFQLRYPEFSWQDFEGRVRHTFMALQDGWMKKQWELARPLETDYLFSTHQYWIERYKREGLTNMLEDIEISAVIPVKIEQDAYYECVTVRIRAKMRDYTIDGNGKVVGGNKKVPRSFSEYWTFIRKAGFGHDEDHESKNCPNCGAPLKINMAGICEYCGSKVTSGDFNWSLSLIEQDEVYEG